MNLSIQPNNYNLYTSSPSFGNKNRAVKAAKTLPNILETGAKSDISIMNKLKNDYTAFVNKIQEMKNRIEQCVDPELSAKYQKRIDYLNQRMESAFRGMLRIKAEIEKQIMQNK